MANQIRPLEGESWGCSNNVSIKADRDTMVVLFVSARSEIRQQENGRLMSSGLKMARMSQGNIIMFLFLWYTPHTSYFFSNLIWRVLCKVSEVSGVDKFTIVKILYLGKIWSWHVLLNYPMINLLLFLCFTLIASLDPKLSSTLISF